MDEYLTNESQQVTQEAVLGNGLMQGTVIDDGVSRNNEPGATWKALNYWYSLVFLLSYLGFMVMGVVSVLFGHSGDFPIQFALPLWLVGCGFLYQTFRYVRRVSKGAVMFNCWAWSLRQVIPFVFLVYAHNFLPGHSTLAYYPFSSLVLLLAMPLTVVPIHYVLLPVQLGLFATWSVKARRSLWYIAVGLYLLILTPLYQELLSSKSSATLRDLGVFSSSYYLPLLLAAPFIAWGLAQLAFPSLKKVNSAIAATVMLVVVVLIGGYSVLRDQSTSSALVTDAGSTSTCSENYLQNQPEFITFMRNGDLWLTDSDGHTFDQITHGAGQDYLVPHAVSPDGTYVAYAEMPTVSYDQDNQYDKTPVIHILTLSTKSDSVLPLNESAGTLYGSLEWSAANQLRFKLSRSFGNYTEYAFSVDGKAIDPSSVIPVQNGRRKVISPDSRYKIEGVAKAGYTQHYLMEAEGAGKSLELPKGDSFVRWLNDSKRIVLMSPEGLRIMDICGNTAALTSNGSDRAPIEQ